MRLFYRTAQRSKAVKVELVILQELKTFFMFFDYFFCVPIIAAGNRYDSNATVAVVSRPARPEAATAVVLLSLLFSCSGSCDAQRNRTISSKRLEHRRHPQLNSMYAFLRVRLCTNP